MTVAAGDRGGGHRVFTGLIQKVGRFERLERSGADWTLAIAHGEWDTLLEHGESVAVQGACLTVVSAEERRFRCNVLDETLRRTTLGSLRGGDPVNLERALRLGDRMGGHMVSGHVDGIGSVASVRRQGADWLFSVSCEASLASEIVVKGSIAVDGVSLTVTAIGGDRFDVRLIPVTWEGTSLRVRRTGDRVNIETDMIGKYVRRYLDAGHASEPAGLDWSDLARAGLTE